MSPPLERIIESTGTKERVFMDKVDVVIAGAGIAGCHLARNLARQGHSVAVVEKQVREKMGHDWWDTIAVDVFDEVDLPVSEPPELLGTCAAAFVSPPLETIVLPAPARPECMHIDRKPLAQRQIKYAEEAGAQMVFGAAVRGPIIEDGLVKGLAYKDENGDTQEVRATLTVDTAGMAGVLRAHVAKKSDYGFQDKVEREGTFVTHREIRANLSDRCEHELVFGKNNGVQWINREHGGLVDFFAGAINFPGRPEPRETIAAMVAATSEAGELIRGGYGDPIPVRHCFDSFVAPGFVLCGDAACQCNPIDGSGMASSLRSAHILSEVMHAALENGRTDVEALWPYIGQYKAKQGVKFVALHAIQKFMVAEPRVNLEVLFRRGVLRTDDFWGKGEISSDGGAAEMLAKILKLIDRPRFIGRLGNAMGTAKALAALYQEFPEKYDRAAFDKWRAEKRSLFGKLPSEPFV